MYYCIALTGCTCILSMYEKHTQVECTWNDHTFHTHGSLFLCTCMECNKITWDVNVLRYKKTWSMQRCNEIYCSCVVLPCISMHVQIIEWYQCYIDKPISKVIRIWVIYSILLLLVLSNVYLECCFLCSCTRKSNFLSWKAYNINITFDFTGFPVYWYGVIGGTSACLLLAVMLVACLCFFCYKQQEDSPIIHEMVSIANRITCDISSILFCYFNFNTDSRV